MNAAPSSARAPVSVAIASLFTLGLSAMPASGASVGLSSASALMLKDGQILTPVANRAAPTDPQVASVGSSVQVDIPADDQEGGASSSISPTEHRFVIEANEPDETVGDPVCITYQFQGAASATATEGGRAAAGFGGDGASAEAGSSPLLAQVAISTAADITIDPDGGATVVFTSGPVTVAQDDGPANSADSGQFTAYIGDEIRLRTVAAAAVAADPGHAASAQASAALETELSPGACLTGVPQIPTLHPVALAALGALLALLGACGVMGGRRRPGTAP